MVEHDPNKGAASAGMPCRQWCCAPQGAGLVSTALPSLAVYVGAAFAEIAGCFAFWAWLRLDRSPLWLVPGLVALALFAFLLTRVDLAFAGRAYAAYGGVYVAASLAWLWAVEGQSPDRWDLVGAAVCVVGAAIILLAPHART